MADMVSLIRWRDPRTDLPTVDHDQSILLTDRSGRVWIALAGHVIEGDVTPFAWAEWPNGKDAVSREDIETVLYAARRLVEHSESYDSPLAKALTRVTAALGGDEP